MNKQLLLSDWRFRRRRDTEFFQIDDRHGQSAMDAFDVSSTIGSLDCRMIAIGALEIAHSVRMHNFHVSPEFLRSSKHALAMLTFQRQIDVTRAVMSLQTGVVRERLLATVVLAFQSILKDDVSQNVFLIRMLPHGGVIALIATQYWFGADVDFMSGVKMIVKRVFIVASAERTSLLDAVKSPGSPVLAAHVVLQRHGPFVSLAAFAANMRRGFVVLIARFSRSGPFAFALIFSSGVTELFVRSASAAESKLFAASTAEEQSSSDFGLKDAVIAM